MLARIGRTLPLFPRLPFVAFVALAALLFTALPVASASAGENASFALGVDVGFIPTGEHTAVSQPSSAPTTFPPTPTPGGDGRVPNAGFALGVSGRFLFPEFGPGLPRLIALAGVTGFFLRSGDATYADLHAGAGNDTGMSLKRNLAVDLAIGGHFPFCRTPKCLELEVFLGATFVHQTLSVRSDETGDGGGVQEASHSTMRSGAMLGARLTFPLVGSVRWHLGALFRGLPGVSVQLDSPSGKSYVGSVDPSVDLQLTAGIIVPL